MNAHDWNSLEIPPRRGKFYPAQILNIVSTNLGFVNGKIKNQTCRIDGSANGPKLTINRSEDP
jgi:hypothetical protein